MSEDGDVTRLLQDLSDGSEEAAERLYPRVYAELKSIAAARLRAERAGHTLSATALVHEAYLKLVRQSDVDWQGRGHFFSIAARAMRRVLLDYAIARKAEKRGGGAPVVTLEHDSAGHSADLDQMLAIDEALTRLAELDARQAQVVELRYFGGLSLEDIATALDVSLSSVNRDWRMARAFLANALG
jgi:RNA polymerase sigma factor (TIGR02999 family)